MKVAGFCSSAAICSGVNREYSALREAICSGEDSLIEKYGKPVSTEVTGRMIRTTVWRDTKENNVIRLFEIASGDKSYILSYRPLQSRENKGL